MNDPTAWFAACGWGLFCHYLGTVQSTAGSSELSAAAWNAQIDAFDVHGLARQLAAVRAPYFCITIGQNSGHFLSPNAADDRLVGIQPKG
jgi:hypothetical protein